MLCVAHVCEAALELIFDDTSFSYTWLFSVRAWRLSIRHFSVAPYITICPSTETYFGLYLRGTMSAVTGIYLFRLLLNIIFFALRSFFTLTNSAYPDEMPHDGISPVCKCKRHVPKNIFHNWNAAEYLFKSYFLFHTCMHSLVVTCE